MLTQSETKYFTPSIEDIRVGYECDYSIGGNWKKTIFTQNDVYDYMGLAGGYGQIRVPYLTKEQIEAEGWKPLDKLSPFTGKPYKWQKVIGEKETGVFNEDHIYTLEFEPLSHLTIHLEWESSWMRFEGNIFVGRCPDINTFRYICKLLGI